MINSKLVAPTPPTLPKQVLNLLNQTPIQIQQYQANRVPLQLLLVRRQQMYHRRHRNQTQIKIVPISIITLKQK